MRVAAQVLLVVLILIALGGIVVNLIVKARAMQAREECQNNLRRIGLGLSWYQDSNLSFPPGTLPNPTLPPEKRLSWYVEAWGMVGDGQALLLIDKTKSWDAEENLQPRVRVDLPKEHEQLVGESKDWLCPANPNRAAPGTPGLTHYVGIAGVGPDAAAQPKYDAQAGVFGYDRRTRRADIKDGASTTVMVAETTADNGPWTAGGPATVRGLDPGRLPYLESSGQFSNRHLPTATNVVFADASVRSLAAGIDPRVFEALATIAGGEQTGQVGEY